MLRMWQALVVVTGVLLTSTALPVMAQENDPELSEAVERADDVIERAEQSEGGLLSFEVDLATVTAIIFLLLLLVLWKFAWGPIASGLDKREQGIADNIAAAERGRLESEKLLQQYEAKLASAQDEVRAIIEEARRDAEHTQKEILKKAAAEAATLQERALREIETATAQSLKEIAEKSADMAVTLAGKIVQRQLTAQDHQRLIDESLVGFNEPSRN